MAKTSMEPAAAIKAFARGSVKVQEATPVKKKGEDGKLRAGFETRLAPLSVEHITGAAQYEDGRIAITTIDGNRHEVKAAVREERA